MNQRRSIKTNLFANWLNHGVSLVIGIFLMPYVLHILGDAQYGSWIFINAIAGYSGLLYLGFGQTISRYVAHYHAKQDWNRLNHISNVIFAIYLGMGVLALITAGVIAWLAPHLSDWGTISLFEIRLVILILGLNVFVGLAGSVFGGVLMGIQRFDIERGVNLTGGILRLILTVLFLKAEWGLLTIAVIFFVVTLIENLGQCFFAFRQVKTFRIGPKYMDWTILKECGSFSGFAFIDAIAWTMIEATDSIVIGIFFSPAAIVPYYIALRLTQFINMPISQIGKVFMPRAGELHANEEHEALQKLVLNGVSLSFLLVSTKPFAVNDFIGSTYCGITCRHIPFCPVWHGKCQNPLVDLHGRGNCQSDSVFDSDSIVGVDWCGIRNGNSDSDCRTGNHPALCHEKAEYLRRPTAANGYRADCDSLTRAVGLFLLLAAIYRSSEFLVHISGSRRGRRSLSDWHLVHY
jgi:hypothetical protein